MHIFARKYTYNVAQSMHLNCNLNRSRRTCENVKAVTACEAGKIDKYIDLHFLFSFTRTASISHTAFNACILHYMLFLTVARSLTQR